VKASDNIKAYLKDHVGFKADAQSVGGNWRIGYGHTGGGDVMLMGPLTKAEAETLFKADVLEAEAEVNRVGKLKDLNQSKYDSLFLLSWIIGPENLKSSRTRDLIKSGAKAPQIMAEMMTYKSEAPGTKVNNAMLNEVARLWMRTRRTLIAISIIASLAIIIIFIVVMVGKQKKKKAKTKAPSKAPTKAPIKAAA